MGAAVPPELISTSVSATKLLGDSDAEGRSAQEIEGFKVPQAGSESGAAGDEDPAAGEILEESSDPVRSTEESKLPIAGGASPSEASEIWPEAAGGDNVAAPKPVTFTDYWMVKIPKRITDRAASVPGGVNSQPDDNVNIGSIHESMKNTRGERAALIQQLRAERSVLSSLVRDIKAKSEENKGLNKAISDLHQPAASKGCKTEKELNDRVAALNWSIEHDPVSVREQKHILNEIKMLKSSREEVRTNEKRLTELRERQTIVRDELKVLTSKRDALFKKVEPLENAANANKEELDSLFKQKQSVEDARYEARDKRREYHLQQGELNAEFYQNRQEIFKARQLAYERNKAALEELCHEQVERILAKWNSDPEYRMEYIKDMQRTRRFRTVDGRELGPGEEPVSSRIVPEKTEKQEKRVSPEPTAADTSAAAPVTKEAEEAPVAPPVVVEELTPEQLEALALEEKEKRREVEMEKAKQAETRKKRRAEKKEAKALQRVEKETLRKEEEKEKKLQKKKAAADGAKENTPPSLEAEETPAKENSVSREPEPVVEKAVVEKPAFSAASNRGRSRSQVFAKTSIKVPLRKKRSLQRQVVDQLTANWQMITSNWKIIAGLFMFFIAVTVLLKVSKVLA